MAAGRPRIRQALVADEAALVRLTEAAYARWTQMLGAPPLPVTEDYLPRIMRGEAWLIEEDAALLGAVVAELHPDHLWIFSVAVDPARRGEGLGRRLLAWAEELAARAGLSVLRLCTNARMESNIALYEALGYRETGRRPNPHREGWILVDMEKSLS